ncbi:MAG: hypothetical protein AAF755_11780 [Pseudomonadota bacterium]
MRQAAISVLVASSIFFVLMLGFDVLPDGAAINTETVMAGLFSTLIFALACAAFQVGLLVFKRQD